jgi:hypothetical protein
MTNEGTAIEIYPEFMTTGSKWKKIKGKIEGLPFS